MAASPARARVRDRRHGREGRWLCAAARARLCRPLAAMGDRLQVRAGTGGGGGQGDSGRRLRHLAAVMDIEGLGYATLTQLIDRGVVEDPSDLYQMSKDQVIQLEGFADRSAQNLVDRIAASRQPDLWRFLFALGIPQVGEATAQLLAADFSSIDPLRAATEEDLQRVEGIGPNMAGEVHRCFHA